MTSLRDAKGLRRLLNMAFRPQFSPQLNSIPYHQILLAVSEMPERTLAMLDDYKDNDTVFRDIKLACMRNNNDFVEYLYHEMKRDNRFDNGLLNRFVYNNVETNFPGCTKLIRFLIRHEGVVISNEVWSYYLSKGVERCDIEGAKVVYHHLIDPVNGSFLISPTSLEGLAIIFCRNNEPDYIIGVRDYFKRYYSTYGHRSCFKTISIALVEAYSQLNQILLALGAFKYLCMHFRGHYNFISKHHHLHKVHSAAKSSYNWRVNNTKSNTIQYPQYPPTSALDQLQTHWTSSPYRPIDARNNTTRIVPIIDGSITINDLPTFNSLLNDTIIKLMTSSQPDKMAKLLSIIKKNHFMLNMFVISNLASSFYVNEAVTVMKKLQPKFKDVMLPVLFKPQMFIVMFRSCKQRLNYLSTNELYYYDKLHDLTTSVVEIMEFYNRVQLKAYNPVYSVQVMKWFLSAMIESPRCQSSLVLPYVEAFVKYNPGVKIKLSGEDYNRMDQVLDEDSVYRGIICRERGAI